jgi:prohibitin 1
VKQKNNSVQKALKQSKLVVSALVLTFLSTSCVVIDDGEVGVIKRFGTIADEPVGSGLTLVAPVMREIEIWNTKLQEVKEAASVPSSEGLIVGLEVSLLFRVLPSSTPSIRKTVGREYVSRLVIPYFRSSMRDTVAAYPVKSIYSNEGRLQISAAIQKSLQEELTPQGITIEKVLLRDVKLPEKFKQSIEAKLTAEQRVQQKEFELDQARKDAEIEVARAKGAAEAQKIINTTLSAGYLQYLWIQTLNQNPNVIYVATEANMPIYKSVANRGGAAN